MHQLDQSLIDASWALLKRQIDFDYIDEIELIHASLDGNVMQVLKRRYECLVLPCAYVLHEASFEKILAFIQAGGTVIVADRLPEFTRESGERSPHYMTLLSLRAEGKLHYVSGRDYAAVRDVLPATVRVTPDHLNLMFSTYGGNLEILPSEIVSARILSHTRINGNELIVFLCNMGAGDYIGKVNLPECKELLKMTPETGEIETLAPATTLPLVIPAFQGIFYVLKK